MTIETREAQHLNILPNFIVLDKIVAVLSVKLKLPKQSLQITIKSNWKIGNTKVPVVLSYQSSSGVTKIAAESKQAIHLTDLIKKVTGLSLPMTVSTMLKFKLHGSISTSGPASFTISSEESNIKVFAIYTKSKKSKPVKAIAMEIKRIQLSKIFKSLTNIDLSATPYFGNLVVPLVGFVYSTGTIKKQEKKLLDDISFLKGRNVNIGKGFTTFVQLPFYSELLTARYEGKNIILQTPKPSLHLQTLLQFVAPSSIKYLTSNVPFVPWSKVFKLGIGNVKVSKNSVSILLDYTAKLSLEKYLQLSIEKIKVCIEKKNPSVSARISGSIKIAGVSFETRIYRNKFNKYVLTAFGNHYISLGKIIQGFHATILPEELNRITSLMQFLKVAIHRPKLFYMLGSKPPQLHIGGTLMGQGFHTDQLDLLLMKHSGKMLAILGFRVPTITLADLLTSVTKFNFRKFPILNQKLPTALTISPITTQRVHFSMGKLSSLQINKGMSIKAPMKFPQNCRSDKFCKFAGKLIGYNTVLSLEFSMKSSTYYAITASLHKLELGKGLTLYRAGLEIIGGVSSRIGIMGEAKLSKLNLVFAARISVGKKGLTLQLSLANCWQKAFGAPWLDICNLLGAIDFAPPTAITGFALGAQVHLGYGSTHLRQKAKAYVGYSLINPIDNFYYAKFNRVTMNSLLKAFGMNWRIPKPLTSSSFPTGFTSSYSALGKELPEVGVSIPRGFRIKATMEIMGLEGHADIALDLPRLLDLRVALPPVRIGTIFAMYSSQKTSSGPTLRAKLSPYKQQVDIGATVYLKVFGVSLNTEFKITNDFYSFMFRLKIFNLFWAHVQMNASHGDIRRTKYKVLGTFGSDLFKSITSLVDLDIRTQGTAAYRSITSTKEKLRQYDIFRRQTQSRVNQLFHKMQYWKGKIFYSTTMQSDRGHGNRRAKTSKILHDLIPSCT